MSFGCPLVGGAWLAAPFRKGLMWLTGWCMKILLGSLGHIPLNETWFVPGENWKVATRMMSH